MNPGFVYAHRRCTLLGLLRINNPASKKKKTLVSVIVDIKQRVWGGHPTYIGVYEWMRVSRSSFRTDASSTSTSSLDQPNPFSSFGRVKAARLSALRPVRAFSYIQMPFSALAVIPSFSTRKVQGE